MRQIKRTCIVLVGAGSLIFLLILLLATNLRDKQWNTETQFSEQNINVHQNVIDQIINYESARTKTQPVVGARKPKVQADATQSQESFGDSRIKTYGDSVVSVSNDFRKGRMDKAQSIASSDVTDFDVPEWLNVSSSIDALIQQAENANRNWTFGWVQLKHPLSSAEIEKELRRVGARVLGQTGDLVRVRVPKNRKRLDAITQLSWVTGLGALPPTHKLGSEIQEIVKDHAQSAFIPVFVVVVTSKTEHMFRTELQKIGLEVGHFDASIRTFSAVMREHQLSALVALDFVQAVETIGVVKASHDTAVPAVGGDALRSVTRSFGSYTGSSGTTVPIGVMDSGFNANHIGLSSLRTSICGINYVGGEDQDLWNDEYGHGSHVSGTIVGNGYFLPKYAGIAPGVEHIRIAKVLSTLGFGSTLNILQAMDFLAEPSSCAAEGWTADEVKPLIINMSLARARLDFDGRSVGPRKLDSIVWTHRQLYVVANSNAGIHGYSNYGAAKNSLAVGATFDNGDLAAFSSHGPTADGRLLPLVVGPGVDVVSAEGDGSYDDYRSQNGTSMSSPLVAGIATLLMDASPQHREEPALVRARLMASAVRPDAWLNSEEAFPKNNTNGPGIMQAKYGMGLVSARTSIVNHDVPEGWTSSGATLTLENGEYGYEDIVVPVGTARLDVVMTWDEPPADSIASTVLNDLDLWIDFNADCDSEPCGEYSSQSKIDNVEWVIIQDPEPGTYRVKVAGERIFTASPRAGVAWTMIRGSTSPQLSLEVDQTIYEVVSGENHNHRVGVTISTDGYVAAGSVLHVDCRTADDHPCELFGFFIEESSTGYSLTNRTYQGSIQREDGIAAALSRVKDFYLGEIGHGEEQRVVVQLGSPLRGPLTIFLTVSAWNGVSASKTVIFRELDSDDEPSDAVQPQNDSYETPTVLESQDGVMEIDTLLTTSESGEPIGSSTARRPTQSLWFQWTAEQSGLASFVVSPRVKLPNWYLSEFPPTIGVFRATGYCCGIQSSQHVASSEWSAKFFAEQGKEYRIRIASSHASMPLTLNWLFGERPPNDDFANAITLTGTSGTVSGHNIGATIEPGEVYGILAATIWYQWTAPEDGDWEFQIEDAQVVHLLVFSGDTVDDLRLVSGIFRPGEPVSVAVAQDEVYYIMIASPNAFSGGWRFENLTWEQQNEVRFGWDWFDDGSQLASSEFGNLYLSHTGTLGVQPDEPEATGIQTGWLKWIAPGDGRYTWYWDTPELQFKAFTGNTVAELNATDAGANNFVAGGAEFVFDATEGEQYAISVGRAKNSNRAYIRSRLSTRTLLNWGETPTNNWISGAIQLSGSTGNVEGSNQFATTGSSLRSHLGHSSLWYSYEADETGWYRFWIEDGSSTSILSAFHPSESHLNIELIMRSRTSTLPGEGVEVVLYIERGSSVLLRVGTTRPRSSVKFALHWSTTDPPNWLVYRGRVADGRRDASGQVISLEGSADMAFNSDGTILFVSTDLGISVFQREPTTGELTLQQEIDEQVARSFLVWDPYRDRLYAHNQDVWRIFSSSSEDSTEFVLDGTEQSIGSIPRRKTHGSPILFMGNSGDYLYRSTDYNQTVYSFNSDGTLNVLGDNPGESHSLYPSTSGNYWWRWHLDELQLLGREVGTGLLQGISKPWVANQYEFITGAFSRDDKYFFTATQNALSQTNFTVYGIDYLTGAIEQRLSAQFFNLELFRCAAAIPRTGSYVVDVLCSVGVYVVEYSPESGEISMVDYVASPNFRQPTPDRFGRRLPRYGLPNPQPGSSPVEASPDGRHVYVATVRHGLLFFERFGNEVIDLTEPEALQVRRLDLLQASKNQIQFDDDIAENGCIATSEWVVDNVSYTVVDSKWQQRSIDSSWSDIEGTEAIEQLCSYSPNDSNEYRMVATFTRDGETIEFASNFFGEIVYERLSSLTVESGEITLDTLSILECTEMLNFVVNDVKYTVKESKWQERDDSNTDWSDISSTITAGELCPYEPDDSLEYRLVGRFVVDDEEDYYSSNVIQEESN